MPLLKSAKKALRQSERRKVRNLKKKRAIKDVVGKIKKLAGAGKHTEALQLLPKAYQALDKAAKRNIIHKNTASRKKSRLTHLLKKSGE